MQTEHQAADKKREKEPIRYEGRSKYCQFHKWGGHATEDCFTLKKHKEERFREDHYKRRGPDRSPSPDRKTRRRTPDKHPRRDQQAGEATSHNNKEQKRQANSGDRESHCSAAIKHGFVHMISGGNGGGGETANARKKHLRQCMAVPGRPTLNPKERNEAKKPKITWDFDDLGDVIPDHDDPLVIQAVIANFGIGKLFEDHGTSADILFLPCFHALGFSLKDLKPTTADLHTFNSTTTKPLGVIQLCLSMGTPPTSKSADIQFLVLDIPSAYNAILGR